MTTRYRTGSKSYNGVSPLPTGYGLTSGAPDLSIPPCGIEDVDTALFNLFDKEIAAQYGGTNSKTPVQKVPVIFAAGEKWAMLKNGRPLRDRNNTLVLPLITVMRTELKQSSSEDVVSRGVNQQTGEMVVKRRLDKTDKNYQSLINRYLLPNQIDLAVSPTDNQVVDQMTTTRKIGELSKTRESMDGALLRQIRTNNVWETIVVPTPQFYTAKYQVTVWTQYTQHANQIIESIFASLLPQGQSWKLTTPKGYWFVAKMEDGSLSTETNFEDMSAVERFIKHTFEVTVPAYFFVTRSPGSPIPIKRYVSSPVISFETSDYNPIEIGSTSSPSMYIVGSDDPTLPISDMKNNSPDQRSTGANARPIYPTRPDPTTGTVISDPALSGYILPGDLPAGSTGASLPRGYSVKVVSKNPKGETVYAGASLGGLEIAIVDDDSKI